MRSRTIAFIIQPQKSTLFIARRRFLWLILLRTWEGNQTQVES